MAPGGVEGAEPLLGRNRVRGDGGEDFVQLGGQLLLALEVVVGGAVGDPRTPRHLAQARTLETPLAHQLDGGANQGLAQIPVVIRLLGDATRTRHGVRMQQYLDDDKIDLTQSRRCLN